MRRWLRVNSGRAAIAIAFGDQTLVEDAEGNEDPVQNIVEELPDDLTYEVWYNQTNWLFKWCAPGRAARVGPLPLPLLLALCWLAGPHPA